MKANADVVSTYRVTIIALLHFCILQLKLAGKHGGVLIFINPTALRMAKTPQVFAILSAIGLMPKGIG